MFIDCSHQIKGTNPTLNHEFGQTRGSVYHHVFENSELRHMKNDKLHWTSTFILNLI